jgi:CheY-like chemotaxis protein
VKNDCILQVEDDEDDVFMLQHAFNRTGIACPLEVVRDGQAAIDYLTRAALPANRESTPVPCLVLLDLNLPARTGFEVLKWIRQHPLYKKLVVVIFSASQLQKDINMAYELGANSYIVKPGALPKLMEIGQLLKGWWLGYNQFAPIDQDWTNRK